MTSPDFERVVASVFVDAVPPADVPGAGPYCEALQLRRNIGRAERRIEPRIQITTVDDSTVVIEESLAHKDPDLVPKQRTVVGVEHPDGLRLMLDGLELSRYVRYFEDESGRFAAYADAHNRSEKLNVTVFERGDSGSTISARLRSVVTEQVSAELEGSFGTYETVGSISYRWSDGRHAWHLVYETVPLGPRGVEQIEFRTVDATTVVLNPVGDPVWESYELEDFLQHGPPDVVPIDNDPSITGPRAAVSVDVSQLDPQQVEYARITVKRWVEGYRPGSDPGFSPDLDPDDQFRVTGDLGIDLIANVYELSAVLSGIVLRHGTMTVRISPE